MILQVILAVIAFTVIGLGMVEQNHFWFEQTQDQSLAQQTAAAWNGFAQGLNSYVQQNSGNINESETVSCTTLQNAGYYGGSCTDPLGEELEGVVAAPYGFPQSWGVIATTAPSLAIMGKFGIGNPSNPQEQYLRWDAFVHKVADLLQSNNLVSAVYNGNTGDFTLPYGGTPDVYTDYNLTATPFVFGSTVDGHGPDGLMAFPQLQKEPGYWLFQAQMLNVGVGFSVTNTSISFENYGYSAVCPPGGVSPVSWTSAPYYNSGVTYAYIAFDDPTTVGNFVYQEPMGDNTLYQQKFVCIPAPESIVNAEANPQSLGFNTENNNIGYSSSYANTDPNNSGFFNGVPDANYSGGQTPVLSGAAYEISVGSRVYTLMAFSGDAAACFPGNGLASRFLELFLYNNASPTGNYLLSPSGWGGTEFPQDNSQCGNGYCAPPGFSLPVVSVNLQ